jgi:hypothetical protein
MFGFPPVLDHKIIFFRSLIKTEPFVRNKAQKHNIMIRNDKQPQDVEVIACGNCWLRVIGWGNGELVVDDLHFFLSSSDRP